MALCLFSNTHINMLCSDNFPKNQRRQTASATADSFLSNIKLAVILLENTSGLLTINAPLGVFYTEKNCLHSFE